MDNEPAYDSTNCSLQVISFSRGPFLFIFNFHPSNSYEKYDVGVEEAGEYTVSFSILRIDIPPVIYHFVNKSLSIKPLLCFHEIQMLSLSYSLIER